jgi:hypothetical protein
MKQLETTFEAPGGGTACSVCPWDTIEYVTKLFANLTDYFKIKLYVFQFFFT